MCAEDLNDRVISSDWRESIDWAGLRTPAPTAVHTPQQKADALGGAQRLRPISGANGGLAMRLHWTLPEHFPPGSVPYLMELMFHPQMVEVHRLCLGTPPLLPLAPVALQEFCVFLGLSVQQHCACTLVRQHYVDK